MHLCRKGSHLWMTPTFQQVESQPGRRKYLLDTHPFPTSSFLIRVLPHSFQTGSLSSFLSVFLNCFLFFVFLLVVLKQGIFYFQRVRREVKDAQ